MSQLAPNLLIHVFRCIVLECCRRFLGLLGLAAVAGCSWSPVDDQQGRVARLPNIILIVADDLGHGDLSCQGQTRWRTPYLDQLAAEGVRLTGFSVAQAVCSASRAAILTGCYPNRLRIAGALGPGAPGLHESETTIAEICRDAGYTTAIFGKWHLGDVDGGRPLSHGFDRWAGIPYSNDMWPLHPDIVNLPPESAARKRGYPDLPWWEDDHIADASITPDEQRGMTARITRNACEFIAANANRPFFAFITHPMPHVPLFCSPEFENASGAGRYGDVIQEIDWSVGEIMRIVNDRGLNENTLIVFTSDNGPWLSYGDHSGTTGGLREGKGTSWEGGVRVPFIARWMGTIPAGQARSTPAMSIDVFPTIERLIDAPPRSTTPDGIDIMALLRGGGSTVLDERPLAYYYNNNDLEAVRQGRWKLILPHSYRTLAGPAGSGGAPGPYRQQRCGLELYDLIADPGERTNVAPTFPAEVARLQKAVERFRADLGDDLTGRTGTGRRTYDAKTHRNVEASWTKTP